jgi:hypothetical protein
MKPAGHSADSEVPPGSEPSPGGLQLMNSPDFDNIGHDLWDPFGTGLVSQFSNYF